MPAAYVHEMKRNRWRRVVVEHGTELVAIQWFVHEEFGQELAFPERPRASHRGACLCKVQAILRGEVRVRYVRCEEARRARHARRDRIDVECIHRRLLLECKARERSTSLHRRCA